MTLPYIDQMAPWLGAEERDAVNNYLATNPWLTEFTRTRDFEQAIAAFTGSRHAVVVMNGTVSLVAALMSAGVGPGDEVIVPNFTMIATANAVGAVGAKPVLVDVDRTTLCLNLDLLEQAIGASTKAIMLVSLNGRAPDMDRASAIAARHGLAVIEDAAQSLGSLWRGTHLGTFGAVGSFSFSAPKIITTGQGGALVTDDDAMADRIRKIKDFGRRTSGIDYHESIGFNFKFTDLQAVIGLEQMKKLPWRVARKKALYAAYREQLAGVPEVALIETNLEDVAPWFIDVFVPDPVALKAHLHANAIGARPVYPAIHSQPPYQGSTAGSFPESDYIAAHGLGCLHRRS